MVGEACLPSNAYYPRTPDYTLCSGVHVCWSEHSDSSFVYGFMILDYGFGTMTATTSDGATGAANMGIPDRLFKRHGRWRSENAKDGYIKDALESRLAVSKSLGL